MIYELRTYTLYPGKVPEFLERLGKAIPIREKYSKPLAVWYTEIGELNQIVSLWPYDSLAHRTQVRLGSTQDPEWQKVVDQDRAISMKWENKILIPADFSPLK